MKNIAMKNDQIRKTFIGGKIILTLGVRESNDMDRVLRAVQEFDSFTPDNDPYEEHDFGKVVVAGEEYFFKFDYYDDMYQCFKEDGNRVLTIMRTDEY